MKDPDAAGVLDRELPDSLTVFPHQMDLPRDRILMIRMSAGDFLDAGFLDQRLLQGDRPRAWFTWERVAERLGEAAPGAPAHYIFHIGHCGSTLISRLLAALGATPLREPLMLRTLAELHLAAAQGRPRWDGETFGNRLQLTLRLFARSPEPKAVKASSFCNDLAPAILASHPAIRATIVYVAPEPYIANMMAGPNSRLDLQALARSRLARLSARIGGAPDASPEMPPGIAAAMSWATETAALCEAMDGAGEARLHAVDFDEMLADMPRGLRALADHALPGTPQPRIDAAASSGILRQYSKAPEYAYDAALRADVLAQARDQWGAEIDAGLGWLRRTAASHPAIGRALERFGGS